MSLDSKSITGIAFGLENENDDGGSRLFGWLPKELRWWCGQVATCPACSFALLTHARMQVKICQLPEQERQCGIEGVAVFIDDTLAGVMHSNGSFTRERDLENSFKYNRAGGTLPLGCFFAALPAADTKPSQINSWTKSWMPSILLLPHGTASHFGRTG